MELALGRQFHAKEQIGLAVSILVFMELALGLIDDIIPSMLDKVSILVFMELALGRTRR